MKCRVESEQDFWESLTPVDGCLEWNHSMFHNGYGHVILNRRHWRAHRLAYFLTRGEIPEGLLVLHECDNRACCNPDHLFLGTHQDNTDDMVAKGRQAIGERSGSARHPESRPRGEANHKAKLTAKDVIFIRDQLNKKLATTTQLARWFNVSTHSISAAARGVNWAHVPMPEPTTPAVDTRPRYIPQQAEVPEGKKFWQQDDDE